MHFLLTSIGGGGCNICEALNFYETFVRRGLQSIGHRCKRRNINTFTIKNSKN